jgi:hypothetical protein
MRRILCREILGGSCGLGRSGLEGGVPGLDRRPGGGGGGVASLGIGIVLGGIVAWVLVF